MPDHAVGEVGRLCIRARRIHCFYVIHTVVLDVVDRLFARE